MNPVHTLFQHQDYVLGKSKDMKSCAWFMETGTGKTIVAIENMWYLWQQQLINFAIVLAPKMVCESVWEYELYQYRLQFQHRIFKWVGHVSDGDKYTITSVLTKIVEETHNQSILPILLINSEAFSHTKVYEFITNILKLTKNIVIIDESTSIKNVRSKRTKGILKLSSLCNYKRIMSGFPVLKSPEDLYSQIRFLGPNFIPYQSFYAFRNEFSVLRHMGRYAITIQHKNLDKLSEQIKPFSFRVTKKDCLDLPDKVRTKRYVDMSSIQAQYYNSMKKQGYIELKKTDQRIFATSFLAQLSKLQQIANGILIQQNMKLENYKYDVLKEIIENEIVGQCVVWFCFTETLLEAERVLKKQFGNDSCKSIYGEIGHSTRIENLKAFQNKHTRILLANPSTVMHGLNLTNCCYSIYFNNSTNLEHRIQSEDRFHRIGQVNKVTYIDIITQNTVEDKILTKLQEHHKIGSDILNDSWEEWFQ